VGPYSASLIPNLEETLPGARLILPLSVAYGFNIITITSSNSTIDVLNVDVLFPMFITDQINRIAILPCPSKSKVSENSGAPRNITKYTYGHELP
jgi:hypothetical protein